MRKAILAFLGIFAAVATITGIVWSSKGVEAMSVKLNVKDFPEHGLTIVSPSNPSFDAMMDIVIKGKSSALAQALKPFSFFIKNTGDRSVIAYKLKWEFLLRDGTIGTQLVSHANTWMLMNAGGQDHDARVAQDKTVIRPNSIWFFSLASRPQPLEDQAATADGSQGVNRIITDQSLVDQAQQVTQEGDQTALLQALNAEMEKYTSITISLDGAFFDDGTFVGADTTNFFAETKAQIDARSDLLQEVERDLKDGKPIDSISSRLQELVDGPDIELDPGSNLTARYKFFKKEFAKGLLSQRSSSGGDKAIRRELELLSKPWPKLRKL